MAIIDQLGLDPFLLDFLEKIGVSLLIGLLIGLEREHWRRDKKIYAGVRTFTIASLTGTLATLIEPFVSFDILLITTVFMALACLMIVYAVNVVYGRSGLTSSVALFFTYLLGIMVAKGMFLVPIVFAVVLTFVLIEKKPLHAFAESLSEKEIASALKFLAVVFVLYPIVPEEPIFDVINLKSAILIVVLVSFISFVSYLSLRRLGSSVGIAYSGLFGGFISSEATVVALANLSLKKPNLVENIYTGSLLAVISMIISNMLIAIIVDNSGATALLMLPPFIFMGLVTVVFVLFGNRNMEVTSEKLEIGSPFALGPAFKFGAIFMFFMFIANAANDLAGPSGTYATAIGGIVSSSAVTASVAALAINGTISFQTAAETAVLAGIISTLTKPIYIKITGSKELFGRSIISFIAIVIAGSIALVVWAALKRGLLLP